MRFAKLSEYRRLFFTPDSRPSMATLRSRIDRNQIPGGRKDESGHYVVDLDELDRITGFHAKAAARERELAADPLLEGLI